MSDPGELSSAAEPAEEVPSATAEVATGGVSVAAASTVALGPAAESPAAAVAPAEDGVTAEKAPSGTDELVVGEAIAEDASGSAVGPATEPPATEPPAAASAPAEDRVGAEEVPSGIDEVAVGAVTVEDVPAPAVLFAVDEVTASDVVLTVGPALAVGEAETAVTDAPDSGTTSAAWAVLVRASTTTAAATTTAAPHTQGERSTKAGTLTRVTNSHSAANTLRIQGHPVKNRVVTLKNQCATDGARSDRHEKTEPGAPCPVPVRRPKGAAALARPRHRSRPAHVSPTPRWGR